MKIKYFAFKSLKFNWLYLLFFVLLINTANAQVDLMATSATGANVTAGQSYTSLLGGCFKEVNGKSLSNINILLYLSKENSTMIDASDILLGSASISALGANVANSCWNINPITIPANLNWTNQSNIYFIFIVDNSNTIAETNENNNVVISQPYILTSTVSFAPGAPTSVSAGGGPLRATVSFVPPVNNGGSTITSYTVKSNPGNITAIGSSIPITVTGLTAGQNYTFTVTATNSAGTSVPSTPSNSVSVLDATTPNAPTNVVAASGYQNATITFNAPTENGGYSISKYTVTSSPGNFTASGSSSPLVVSGLTNGTAYTFTVQAENSLGKSVPSAPSNTTIPNDSLLAHYSFDGNANDVSGNNNNGIISGGVTFTADADGNPNAAAVFNGTDGFITIPSPNSILFKSGASFTITAKVKSIDNPGTTGGVAWSANTIFLRYGCPQIGGSSEIVSLEVLPGNGNLRGYVRSASVPILFLQNTSNTNDVYRQFTLVKDAKAGKLLLYVDGVLVKSSNLSAAFASTEALKVWIGKSEFCGGANDKKTANLFKGTMDDLKIYSRALSAAEIAGTVTGIENENASQLASIASNPTDNQFEIFTPNLSSVSVYTIDGKLVDTFESYQTQYFGSNYQTGIYLVKVNTNNGEKVFKVVKL